MSESTVARTGAESRTAFTFVEGAVTIDGFTMRYAEGGGGPETIVVLTTPGRLPVSRTWELMAEAGHRVIAVEIPDDPVPVRDRTQLIRSAVETLVSADFHLVGASFGSQFAAWFALGAGSQVKSLVLLSPTLIASPTLQGLHPEGFGEAFVANRHGIDHDVLATIVAVEGHALNSRWLAADREELQQEIHQLDVQTLIVIGTLDTMVPSRLLGEYRQLIPGAELSLVYDAGHALDMERPESLTNLLDNYVSYGPEYKVTRSSGILFP